MLQAADGMRIHVREPNILDQSHKQCSRHGLSAVEQRANAALLFMQFLQSWIACKSQGRVAQGRHHFDHHSCGSHCRLFVGMLCF